MWREGHGAENAEILTYLRRHRAEIPRRHPELLVSWLPTSHGVEADRPAELAALIAGFAATVGPA